SSRRRHTRFSRDWSSDVCSSDLTVLTASTARTVPLADEVAAALEGPLTSGELGGRTGVAVADLSTGEVLYERDATTAMTPASTRSEERRVGEGCVARAWPRHGNR